MASVWWATHEMLNRDVALKVSPMGRDEQVVARFVREARIIGKFQHPNIVGVVDAGVLQEEGYLFLAMELLRGMPFADGLIPNRPLPAREVLPILIGVCRGLEVAHAAGVVHRDMKPENIFLAKVAGQGIVPKIVDFGISQMEEACESITFDGQILGTPSYMSPEQARGERNIDARADLWAIGVILYEALAGRQPFKAESHHAVLHRIVGGEPVPLPDSIHPALRAIVARCLQKDRTRRYPDAASLRADLEAALAGCEHEGPVLLPSLSAPARIAITDAAAPLPAAARMPAAPAASARQTRAWLADLRRTATLKWSGAWARFRGAGCEATLGSAQELEPRRAARPWTALGFAGGVTAAAAIVVGLVHSEPASAGVAAATVARDAAPAVVAGLAEAARRAGGVALASAEGMPRPSAPVAALPTSGEGASAQVDLQGDAAADSSGSTASARPAMEERSSSSASPWRRRRGVTRPGF